MLPLNLLGVEWSKGELGVFGTWVELGEEIGFLKRGDTLLWPFKGWWLGLWWGEESSSGEGWSVRGL